MYNYTMPVTVIAANRPEHLLCGQYTKNVQLWTLSRMLGYFLRIYAHPNSQDMSINISQYMEYGFITDENVDCKYRKEVTVERVKNFIILGSFILQQLVPVTLELKEKSAELCALLRAYLIYVDCERKPLKLHPPELQ
jgi:hypothetical protein